MSDPKTGPAPDAPAEKKNIGPATLGTPAEKKNIGPATLGTPAEKKKLTLSEDDIRIDRRGPGGSVGRVGAGPGGSSKVIDPNQRGPGAPTDPDA